MSGKGKEIVQDGILEQLKGQLFELEESRKSVLGKISEMIPKLEKEKEQLQQDIARKQERILKIDEQTRLITRIVKYYEDAFTLKSTDIDEHLAMSILKLYDGSPLPAEVKSANPQKIEKATA